MTKKAFRTKEKQLIYELGEHFANLLLGEKLPIDIINCETGELLIPCNRKITKTLCRKIAQHRKHLDIDPSPIRNKVMHIIEEFEPKFIELQKERDRLDIPALTDTIHI